MKNLKKVLALALAVIMVMSMFTVAFAAETKTAADLTDYADINKKDAVNLCVDLGIINGKLDGSFDPAGNIDRASWAKMVYFAATGDDNADAYVGSATGLKDIAGNWAEGYINFLAANGYVSGDLNGNYNPSNNVTVAEACKVLLTVLGYDADDRGYQNNAAWSGNIMRDAKSKGLMADVDATQTALVALTRENAAQIIYNALQTKTVEMDYRMDNGVKYVIDYTEKDTLGFNTFGLYKVEVTINDVEDGEASLSTSDSWINSKNLTGIKADVAQKNQKAVVFVKVTRSVTGMGTYSYKFEKVYSSVVAALDNDAYATITGGFKLADAYTKGEDDYVAENLQNSGGDDNVTYYYNGVKKGVGSAAYALSTVFKAGEVVDFYLNDNGMINEVYVYHYNVGQLSGDVETRTKSDELQVKFPGVTGLTAWTAASSVSGYADLKEDDVILWYKDSQNGNIVIKKADVIENAKVTSVSSDDELTINGKKYEASGLSTATQLGLATGETFKDWDNKDDEFNFYLDTNGTICFVDQITETYDKNNTVVVLGEDYTAKSIKNDGAALDAKLLFTDGTTEIVEVAKVDGTKIADINYNASTGALKTTGAFYNYKVNSNGKYELTEMKDTVASGETDRWDDTITIAANSKIEAKNKFSTASSYTADSKTIFVVAKTVDDETTYYSYTGFKNVPAMDKAEGWAIAEEGKTVAKYVFLKTKSYNDDVPDGYIYLKNTKWATDADDNYVMNIVDAEGNETTITVDSTAKTTLASVGFYEIKTANDNGVVTSVAAATTPAAITAIGNEVVTIGGTSCALDEDTIVVVVDLELKLKDGKTEGSTTYGDYDEKFVGATLVGDVDGTFDLTDVSELDTTMKTYNSIKGVIIGTDNKTADYVYVIRVANP